MSSQQMSWLRVGSFAPLTGTWAPLPVPERTCRRRPSTLGSDGRSSWLRPPWPATAGVCCAYAAARACAARKRVRKLARRVLQPYAIEPINPYLFEMKSSLQRLAEPGTGILDTSESIQELGSLLIQAGAENTPESRRAWREFLYSTEGLGRFCSCVVLSEEALRQATSDGRPFVELLQEQGIIVGVRADTGSYPLNGYGEKGTDGYVDLDRRCRDYYKRGVRVAKWRTEVFCTMELPTDVSVWENTTRIGQAARACQAGGLAFAAEVDITMGPGNHSIDRTAYVAEKVYSQALRMMNEYDANLEAAVLATGLCAAGEEAGPVRPEDAAELTARCLRRTVPPALAGVHLLPGAASPETAARNLRAAQEAAMGAPWVPLPVYGGGLLAPALKTWAAGGGEAAARSKLLQFLEASGQSQLGMLEEDTLPQGLEGV